ncbi:MAG: BTAD domain-containing putative transcriptional regulator [Candidatus Promineifilaceae bacterium]|nr:BTAD domain-containing putative transcriptional regulator [Candidatus Promineifilaceae bacterium]
MAIVRATPRLQIRLLGEFQILVDGQTISGLYADRPQSLLAYLLLHRHSPQSRQHLAFMLWPDSLESQAFTNLRNLLHTVRHTLPGADAYILANKSTLQWNPDLAFELDVAQFEEAVKMARAAHDDASVMEWLAKAAAIYNGELLPDIYDDWIFPLREEMRQQFLEALHQLVSLLEIGGDYQSAVRVARRLWQQDMLDEAAALRLMHLHAVRGDRAGVQRIYQTLVENLKRELDVEPADSTQAAYQEHLQAQANTQTVKRWIDPLQAWQPRPVPAPATPFIGREKELADIAAYLAEPQCRWLTVVGLSGMGKTRLILQTAAGHQAVFSAGVAYVSLSSLTAADQLPRLIAQALEIAFNESLDPGKQIISALRSRELLLVLDNLDSLLSAAVHDCGNGAVNWLVELLQATPHVKLLATSRQRLELPEEWVYEIAGLPLPDTIDEDTLFNSSAVALFLSCARRADRWFTPANADIDSIVRICHLVDGMPLAIELAASWVRLLTCAEIVDQIEQDLYFLRTESRSIPERHRNMRAIFDHTWQLLAPVEQQALARLSRFRGCFQRTAAQQEAGVDLDTLSALLNKSLLQRVGQSQFKIHNLVRQYALLKPLDVAQPVSAAV